MIDMVDHYDLRPYLNAQTLMNYFHTPALNWKPWFTKFGSMQFHLFISNMVYIHSKSYNNLEQWV